MDSINRLSTYLLLLSLFLIMNSCSALESFVDHKAILRKDLFADKRYDCYNSPSNETLLIAMHFVILHIQDLEDSTGTLITNGWLLANWRDSRLKWDPKDYGNARLINVPKRSIWTPDLMLHNNAEAGVTDFTSDAEHLVLNSGDVLWLTPVTLKSTCPMDHWLYPFDKHVCTATIGSWNYNVDDLEFSTMFVHKEHEEELISKFHIDNPQWLILQKSQSIENLSFEHNSKVIAHVFKIQIHLQRQDPLYKFLLVTPSILAMMLTIALFCLPPNSKSKFTIGTIVIGIQMALLLNIGLKIPPGGQRVPAIVLLCGHSLILSSISITLSVIVIRLTHNRNKEEIPQIMKRIYRGPIGRLLLLRVSKIEGNADLVDKTLVETDTITSADDSTSNMDETHEQTTPVTEDWMLVGTAIDRICFILYCLAFVIICTSSFA